MESYVNVKKEIKIFICEISEISLVIEIRNEYTWLNENVKIIFSWGNKPKKQLQRSQFIEKNHINLIRKDATC